MVTSLEARIDTSALPERAADLVAEWIDAFGGLVRVILDGIDEGSRDARTQRAFAVHEAAKGANSPGAARHRPDDAAVPRAVVAPRARGATSCGIPPHVRPRGGPRTFVPCRASGKLRRCASR